MASNIRFFFGTTGEYGKYLHWFDESYTIRNSSMPSNFPTSMLKNPWQYLIGWNKNDTPGNPQADTKYQKSISNIYYAKIDELDGWTFLSLWDQSGYHGSYNFPTIYALYGSYSFNDLILDMSTYIPDIYNRIINYTGNNIAEYKCTFSPVTLNNYNYNGQDYLLAPVCKSSDGLSYSQYYQFNLDTNNGVDFFSYNNIEADGYFFIHNGYVDENSASILTRIAGTINENLESQGKSCYHILSPGNYTLEFTSISNIYGGYSFLYQLHNNAYDQNIIIDGPTFNSNLSSGVPGFISGQNICNFYYFTVDSGKNISITVNANFFTPVMNLFYADGYGHIGNFITNNGSNNYITQYLNPGTYGIELSASNIVGSLDYSIFASTTPSEQCSYDLWGIVTSPYNNSINGSLVSSCISTVRSVFGNHYAKTYALNVEVPASSSYVLTIDYNSNNYDCYLYLLRASDNAILAQDDDSGPGVNSQIIYVINNINPVTTIFNYLIECTSYGPESTGLFDVTINVSVP